MTDSNNPKKFHLKDGGNFGFESGKPIPVAWPAVESLEFQLVGELLEAGATIPDVPRAVQIVGRKFDEAGDFRGADILGRLLDRLTADNANVEEAGRRVLTLAYLSGVHSGPGTITELAARMGVSRARAWEILQSAKVNAKNQTFAGDLIEN